MLFRSAREIAERVRDAVRDVKAGSRRRAGVRCSIGMATYPTDATESDELLLTADRALYAAKRAGRDRIGTAADGLALTNEFVPLHTPVDELKTAPTS